MLISRWASKIMREFNEEALEQGGLGEFSALSKETTADHDAKVNTLRP